ncbi:hypothetical protein ACU61A_42580 [Pseudonocardia sichuanensis]
MIGRRRWAIRARVEQPAPRTLVVEVPPDGDGSVVVAVDGASLVLEPEDVSRVRRALQLAQVRALFDRGRW